MWGAVWPLEFKRSSWLGYWKHFSWNGRNIIGKPAKIKYPRRAVRSCHIGVLLKNWF